MNSSGRRSHLVRLVASLSAVLVLSACSSDPPGPIGSDAAPGTDAAADVNAPEAGPVDAPVTPIDVAGDVAVDTGTSPADASVTDVPAVDVPAVDVPAVDVPAVDVPAVDVPAVDVPAVDVPAVDVPAVDVGRPDSGVFDVVSMDVGRPDAGVVDVPRVDVSAADVPGDSFRVPVHFADVASAVPGCLIPLGDPRREVVETRCDGLDNDCDGWVDQLLPVGPNACSTGALGVCATGWAACDGTTRICQAPAATPEVNDGRDNDCNGRIDDTPTTTAAVRSRALLLVPNDLWLDGPLEVDTVASILDQWGIAYDRPTTGATFESQLPRIATGYSLVVIPGYMGAYEFDAAARAALEAFARNGGVVVVQKPVISATHGPDLGLLLGLTTTTRHFDVTTMRFTGSAPVTSSLDSPEERWLEITENTVAQPMEVYTLSPAAGAGVTVLAHAYAAAMDVGASVTRRALGRGAIYGVGHDLHGFRHYRCYINCFEPSGDVLGLFLRDALREGTAGHVVLKHTVPGLEDSLLELTHDVDAVDSALPGEWGASGALQMASVEAAHHARGTYYVTTNYIEGYWSPETVRYLCALGMCPAAAHSVTHRSEASLPLMASCLETRATYNPVMSAQTTLCGEIRVALELLTGVVGQAPRLWRAPYLQVNPSMFDVLAAQGVISDSSYAIGDFKTNLPMSLSRTGISQEIFHHRPILEHLIAIEDGLGYVVAGVVGREEISPTNFPHFFNAWTYAALRNATNGAHSTALVHPSAGIDVPQSNIGVKFTAADRLLTMAEGAGIRTDLGIEAVADFWRGREGTNVDADYDSARGYRGTLVVGAVPVTGLTLEFGDAVTAFACDTCGAYTVSGRRVVLRDALPPGRRATFTAR